MQYIVHISSVYLSHLIILYYTMYSTVVALWYNISYLLCKCFDSTNTVSHNNDVIPCSNLVDGWQSMNKLQVITRLKLNETTLYPRSSI